MNILGWLRNTYQSFTEYVGWSKPQVAPKPPAQDIAPEQVKAASLEKGENLSISKPKAQGTAQVNLGHSSEEAISQWKAAAAGKQVPGFQMAVKNGMAPTVALTKSPEASKALNRSQKDNIAAFMKEVAEYGQVKESRNADFTKKNLIDVLTEGIKEHGLTMEQLELLGNGDFTVADYITLVKNGESVV